MNSRIVVALIDALADSESLRTEEPGLCYAACEAYYHAAGGRPSGLTLGVVIYDAHTHYFLRQGDGKIIDLTAGADEPPPPYEHGLTSGFITERPSKPARELLRQAGRVLAQSGWFLIGLANEAGRGK